MKGRSLIRRIFAPLAFVTLVFVITACDKKPVRPPPPQELYLFHTITFPGETLGVIAAWYTGTAQNWMALRDANPELNPAKLRLGSVVKVPRRLLVKDAPLPKSAIKSRTQDPSLVPSTPAPTTSEPEPTNIIPPPDVTAQPEPTAPPVIDEVIPEPEAPPPVVDVVEPTAVPQTNANTSTTKPGEEGRVKTRDELLKELLEDY